MTKTTTMRYLPVKPFLPSLISMCTFLIRACLEFLALIDWNPPFDSAQDREPVERLVDPFEFWCLKIEIYFAW
jgi:hypothetical protein